MGIAPENVAKIYDPFYTTKGGARHRTRPRRPYGIVQEHSGHIAVESIRAKARLSASLCRQSARARTCKRRER